MESRIARAKQFLPFDALKGFKEALIKKEKELECEEEKELSEESLIELDKCFNKIEIGSIIKIKYYKNKRYNELKGKVTNIDYIRKKIQINNDAYINISDIISIII